MLAQLSNVEKLEAQLNDPNSPAVVLDGGSGTMARDTLRDDHGIELIEGIWSATAQVSGHGLEILYKISSKFARAGAMVLTASNFRTQVHIFEEAGLCGAEAKDANRMAIEATIAARDDAGNPDVVVAFSQPPMDDCYKPLLRFSFDELVRMHYQHAENSVGAGGELMICETISTIDEARAALIAADRLGIKAIASFYCRDTAPDEKGIWLPNPKKAESLEEAVYAAGNLGAISVATNCIKPTKGLDHVKFLLNSDNNNLPVGTWVQGHEYGCSEIDHEIAAEDYPDHVLDQIKTCIRLGARFVGGCCNVDDKIIRSMVSAACENAKV